MPNWTDAVRDTFIRNVANAYVFDSSIEAFNIFPKVDTRKLSGYIAKYKKADWARIGTLADYKRVGATESVGDDYALDKQTYRLEQFSFHKDLTREEYEEYDNPYDPVNDSVRFVINRIRRVLLKQLVDTYITSSVWGTDEDESGTKWNAKTSGTSDTDPIDVIASAADTIQSVTGYHPNKLVVAPDVYNALKANTYILDRMQTTNDKIVTPNLIARLFDLDQLHVLNAINSSATDYMIAGKALLLYTPNVPSKMEPSAGYHLTYRGRDNYNVATKRIEMPAKNDALRIEADMWVDPLVVSTDLGYYFYNIV